MEYLVTAIVKLPDSMTEREIISFETELIKKLDLDGKEKWIGGRFTRKPLVYWAFHALNCPFPLDWRE